MFHNISNPKWFGNWSRLEDDYLGNGGTDIADNFTFSKMEKTGGLFGSINEEAHEMASGRKEIDTQTKTKDAPEADADKEVK